MEDDFDLQEGNLDNGEELDDLGESAATGEGGEDAPPATDNDNSDAESKRVADLMSKWQKAEARAQKAEAALNKTGGKQTKGKKSQSDFLSEFEQFAREDARQRLFNGDPRFAKYGLEADVIRGESFEEMRASAAAQAKMLDSLESRIRNEVLAEHGLEAGISGASAGRESNLPDFGSMSEEDFEKFIQKRSAF